MYHVSKLAIFFFTFQVDEKLNGLKHAALENKTFLDGHTSSIEGAIVNGKRKWETFFSEAQTASKEGCDFSSAKHCQMEDRLQAWYVTITKYFYSLSFCIFLPICIT